MWAFAVALKLRSGEGPVPLVPEGPASNVARVPVPAAASRVKVAKAATHAINLQQRGTGVSGCLVIRGNRCGSRSQLLCASEFGA